MVKLRRRLAFHSLKKGKVRQTWNKYNLYNLSKVERTIPTFIRRTFFQQKWTAKSLARAYHGEHINERKWKTMFSRRMLSVVNMDPEYMAHNDGAEQALGRGSGRHLPREDDLSPWHGSGKTPSEVLRNSGGMLIRHADREEPDMGAEARETAGHINPQEATTGSTPYMHMAFAPQERRIDVAIFRAMFASSVRQARQFVVHGAVTVNGQKMNHASYLLNPGDMFMVDTDCVMLATGAKKNPPRQQPTSTRRGGAKPATATEGEDVEAEAEAEDAEESTPAEISKLPAKTSEAAVAEAEAEAPSEADKQRLAKRLKFLSKTARAVLTEEKDDMSARRKQHLRAFIKEAKDVSSALGTKHGDQAVTSDIVGAVNAMLKEMVLVDPKVANKAEASGAFSPEETAQAAGGAEASKVQPKQGAADAPAQSSAGQQKTTTTTRGGVSPPPLSDEDARRLAEMVRQYEDNPVDESKPYLTPWRPRPYMSPFAFIPRYLEVNQNICAAVYLRHPVARRGQAEVPSPFPTSVMQLAFNWYLRRR